jgi:hypothetical protein
MDPHTEKSSGMWSGERGGQTIRPPRPMHVSGKWLLNQLRTWWGKWGRGRRRAETTLRGTSSNKRETVLSGKSAYWFGPRLFLWVISRRSKYLYYTLSNRSTTDERWIGKDLEGIGQGLIEVQPHNLTRGTEESHEKLRMVGDRADIRTEHLLPQRQPARYRQ